MSALLPCPLCYHDLETERTISLVEQIFTDYNIKSKILSYQLTEYNDVHINCRYCELQLKFNLYTRSKLVTQESGVSVKMAKLGGHSQSLYIITFFGKTPSPVPHPPYTPSYPQQTVLHTESPRESH